MNLVKQATTDQNDEKRKSTEILEFGRASWWNWRKRKTADDITDDDKHKNTDILDSFEIGNDNTDADCEDTDNFVPIQNVKIREDQNLGPPNWKKMQFGTGTYRSQKVRSLN